MPFSVESDSSFLSLRSLGADRMSTSMSCVSGSVHTGVRVRFWDLEMFSGTSTAVAWSASVPSSGSEASLSKPSVAVSTALPATRCSSASAPPKSSFSRALACAASSAVITGSWAFFTSAMLASGYSTDTPHVLRPSGENSNMTDKFSAVDQERARYARFQKHGCGSQDALLVNNAQI